MRSRETGHGGLYLDLGFPPDISQISSFMFSDLERFDLPVDAQIRNGWSVKPEASLMTDIYLPPLRLGSVVNTKNDVLTLLDEVFDNGDEIRRYLRSDQISRPATLDWRFKQETGFLSMFYDSDKVEEHQLVVNVAHNILSKVNAA